FIEARFGVHEPNITPWRRTVCGDLTSAFDFAAANAALVSLPKTIAYEPPDKKRHPDYKPAPPVNQSLPTQEPGARPARALPYELHVESTATPRSFKLRFNNTGKQGAVFHVRSAGDTPRSYTVGPNANLSDNWKAESGYDLAVHGPNGFL